MIDASDILVAGADGTVQQAGGAGVAFVVVPIDAGAAFPVTVRFGRETGASKNLPVRSSGRVTIAEGFDSFDIVGAAAGSRWAVYTMDDPADDVRCEQIDTPKGGVLLASGDLPSVTLDTLNRFAKLTAAAIDFSRYSAVQIVWRNGSAGAVSLAAAFLPAGLNGAADTVNFHSASVTSLNAGVTGRHSMVRGLPCPATNDHSDSVTGAIITSGWPALYYAGAASLALPAGTWQLWGWP